MLKEAAFVPQCFAPSSLKCHQDTEAQEHLFPEGSAADSHQVEVFRVQREQGPAGDLNHSCAGLGSGRNRAQSNETSHTHLDLTLIVLRRTAIIQNEQYNVRLWVHLKLKT